MSLSTDLISQFVKATSDKKKEKKEASFYGTIVEQSDSKYVRFDGAELLTPISATTDTKDGDRVVVMVKNHTAIVTGNLSSPAARVDDVVTDVSDVIDKIEEFEILVGDMVSTEELNAAVARIDQLTADNVIINNELTANKADISELEADNVTINQKLSANEATIENLETDKLDANIADITYATIENLDATNATIHNLEATYGEFEELTTEKFTATDASIKNLEVTKLEAQDIEGKFANIDFANIGTAAIEEFFAKSGLIKDVIIGEGTITGELVGVTIKGDLIEGNTIVADKLVIKGEDGLYYKLNTDGVTTEAQQTDHNSLNGTIIRARSITASKINVSDLVAFGATIGGFKITSGSLYSGVKSSIHNTTTGIHMTDDGQIAIGDASRFIKYYEDAQGTRKLEIVADAIRMGSSGSNIIEEIENAVTQANEAQSALELLKDAISTMVTDENGNSLMTQTSNGWSFNMGNIEDTLDKAAAEINNLSGSMSEADSTIANVQALLNDLSKKTAYIVMTTDNDGNPCIELGKEGNAFKVRITNTSVDFIEGSSKIAYVNNKSLYIERAIIKDELQIGEGSGFVWKKRSNGNMGLRWIGG